MRKHRDKRCALELLRKLRIRSTGLDAVMTLAIKAQRALLTEHGKSRFSRARRHLAIAIVSVKTWRAVRRDFSGKDWNNPGNITSERNAITL
jgi:hypothetical protein